MPVFIDLPVAAVKSLGMELAIAVNGAGPDWGGCELWVSTDNVSFYYRGTLWGGTVMGTLTATFASGSDPDTTHTLSVDLTPSKGVLLPGTTDDANQATTLCYVDGEFVAYTHVTLTAQYRYDLATSIRRGLYGSAIASHASASVFVRLKPGTYFSLPYVEADIGKTLHFKFLSFNKFGGGHQMLDQVSSVAHTIAGPPTGASATTPLSTLHGGSVLAQTADVATGGQITSIVQSFTSGGVAISATANTLLQSVAIDTSAHGGPVDLAFSVLVTSGGAGGTSTKFDVWISIDDSSGATNLFSLANLTLAGQFATPVSFTYIDAPSAASHTYYLFSIAAVAAVFTASIRTLCASNYKR